MKNKRLLYFISCVFLVILCVGCNSPENPNTENSESEIVESEATESEITESESTEEDTTGTENVESESTEDETTGTEIVEDHTSDLAISNATSFVNVREKPNTDSNVIGRIYGGALAQVISVEGDAGDWLYINSGNVTGYVFAKYFITGEAAEEVKSQQVVKYATVTVSELNVRKKATSDSTKIGLLKNTEKVKLLEDCGTWLKIQYTDETVGYIFAEYADIVEEFTYAKTNEEVRQEEAHQRELANRVRPVTPNPPSNTPKPPSTDETYTSNDELRQAIIDYAMQYLGYPYLNGGSSLKATDCSGFTMLILKQFGYSIGRTPQDQYKNAGRPISYSEARPGDIICYSSNGKTCTHVAFYIGNGKILHASNPRDGVKISPATYTNIFGVRNVID